MVFSENRTSLKEIKDFLDSSLTIKCELFYGQAKKVINDDVYD